MTLLPLELILLTVEMAAWRGLPHDRRWVATLCRVCRSVRAVVEPILYRTIILGPRNSRNSVSAGYKFLPLHTRILAIRGGVPLRDVHVVAFRNINVLVCAEEHLRQYRENIEADRTLRLAPTALVIASAITALPRVLTEVKHLFAASLTHLALPVYPAAARHPSYGFDNNFNDLPLTHVHFDVVWSSGWRAPITQAAAAVGVVKLVLQITTLKRIVCRMVPPYDVEGDARTQLRGELAAYALIHHDLRVAFDDRPRVKVKGKGSPVSDEGLERLYFGDALEDVYELWDAGSILYPDL